MADQQPGDTTPAAGMPEAARFAGSGEPPTATLPGRWSGAAPIPESEPRRSLWSRMVDRINGPAPVAGPVDDRTAVPAVDPWADQDTPVWADAYTTPAAPDPSPSTRVDLPPVTAAPPPRTRVDAPPVTPAPERTRPAPATVGALTWARRSAAALSRQVRPPVRTRQAEPPPVPVRTPPAAAPPRGPVRTRPATAPPWAGPPQTRPKPRPRRRLRRFTLLTIVGGVLLAYWLLPGARQYPVTAALPGSFADLDLRDTDAGRRAAQKLAEQLQQAGADGDAFAGVYADSRGKRVTVFGVTGLRLTPASDAQAQLDRLTDTLKLKDIRSYDLGEFGAHQQCGTGRLDGTSIVACTWADHGSLATVLLTRRSLTESATLVAGLRDTVLAPG